MNFKTDEQTINDLGLFGQRDEAAVYAIFNRTQTRGGAAELEDWFRYPMADVEAINRRSEVIRYFSETATAFPLAGNLFDQTKLYLSEQDERTRLSGVPTNL